MRTGRIDDMAVDRRRELVAVAACEFSSAGYRNASLNRIVETCRMSKSSFYYFLPSKAALFDFVVRELIGDLAAEVAIAAPEEFSGPGYWRKLEEFFWELIVVMQRRESYLALGRMFYAAAPETAKAAIEGTFGAIRAWVEEVLQVGRRADVVRTDLPEALQYSLILGILQVFDEWTLAHFEEFAADELSALAAAQFATLRRVLEAAGTASSP